MDSNTNGDDKLEEYKVLPLKFSEDDESSSHSIFMKKYRSDKKSQEKPVGKTLLVLNIPPYATKMALKRVFTESVGDVERITLIDSYKNEHKSLYQVHSEFFNDPLPSKFFIAFVVFRKSSSLDAIFQLNSLPALSTKAHPILTGIEKWTAEYNSRYSIDTDAMQTEINLYMQHYDKVKAAAEAKGGEEDDDGWVTVGKQGNNSGFTQNEKVVSKLEQKVQSMKKKNIKNFYSFEFRDGKKRQLMELRKKFEDDKAKLNTMKQNRRFKPF